MSNNLLYFTEPIDIKEAHHIYGTLTLNKSKNYWVIDGEPAVVELAKRLFPGSEGLGRGKAKFPNQPRLVGDLNWLMLRYPLDVHNQDAWKIARTRAIEHVEERISQELMPKQITPPPDSFNGELRPFQKG